MDTQVNPLPLGNGIGPGQPVRSAIDLGALVRAQRRQQALTQQEVAGLGNTGNRFIVELERGKPTVQLQKVLDLIDLLGLELVLRPKTPRVP
ncbi:helix-turn-helix domain-containing protein [Xylophilus sp. GW821-FHT01B05]